MWTYLLGPFLAFLPNRWRKALPFAERINWPAASVVSGLAEFRLALTATLYWYSYSMTTWVERGLDYALSGKAGPADISEQAIGFVAYVIWAGHPLTWVCGYFLLEGAARLCGGAFTGNILGTLPLFLLDKVYVKIFRRDLPKGAVAANAPPGSFATAIHEKVLTATRRSVADELLLEKDGADELLQVRASRPKPDWAPPRVVRYQDSYYRLETCSRASGPRPFHYTLRKLPAGVPSRTLLVYQPE